MSGYTPYWCVRCGMERKSSNSRAQSDGTVCPPCMIDERDRKAGKPEFVPKPRPALRVVRGGRARR